ncbi:Zn(2)-C6 fungal-specific transcription factor [Phycomyces blakesleeanus]
MMRCSLDYYSDLCRRKKIKCDGTIPICSNCNAFHLKCSYKDTTKKVRRVPFQCVFVCKCRQDISKGDDPRSQILRAELSEPLKTAGGEQIRSRPVRRHQNSGEHGTPGHEKRTNKSRKNTQDSTRSNSPQTTPCSPQLSLIDSPVASHVGSPHSPQSVEDNTGQLSMGESGEVRYLGKSSGFYLLQNSRTYQNGAFHFTGRNQRSGSQSKSSLTNSSFDPLELPPKDLSENLVKLYFRHIYPVLPLFYKKRLVSSTCTVAEMLSPLLLNAIYAVASRMSPDVRVRSDPTSADTAGDVYFERARCLLDDYYDIPRISTIQALILLAAHQHGAMKPARAWLYSGMAFRMAQDLGLHRNCDHWDIPSEERERRKRVFWCCYILDRILSASYGRSATFEERDCDVPLPTVDDDDDEDEPETNPDSENAQPPVRIMIAFTHLISLCHILGDVLKNVYYAKSLYHASINHVEHILSSLNQRLDKWHDNLPFSIRYDPSNPHNSAIPEFLSPIVGQLHMVYYTTVILLHRPFIPGQKQAVNIISFPSNEICLSAANSILSIVNIMLEKDYLRYTLHYIIYCLFTAAIIFVQTASSPEEEKALEARVSITKILRSLDEIETTWTTASRTCGILAELVGLREINLGYDSSERTQDSRPESIPDNNDAFGNHNNISYEDTVDTTATAPSNQTSSYEDSRGWNNNSETRNTVKADAGLRNIYDSPHFGNHSYLPNYMSQSNIPEDKRGSLHPSSSWSEQSSLNNQDSQFVMTPLTDPFAAPNTVVSRPLNRQFNPFGSAFWGVPSSLDMNEWSTYLGNQGTQTYTQQQQQNNHHHQQDQNQSLQPEIQPRSQPQSQSRQLNYISNQPFDNVFPNPQYTDSTSLMPSRLLSPVHNFKSLGPLQMNPPQVPSTTARSAVPSYFPIPKNASFNPTNDLIHSDNSVDVLSGVNMPMNLPNSPSESSLLGLLSNPPDNKSVRNSCEK